MQARKNFDEFEIGSKYNDWTIIGKPEKSKEKDPFSYYVKCVCKCGKEKDVSIYNLNSNKSKQCRTCFNATKRKSTKIGEIYGQWTVIADPIYNTVDGTSVLCRCSCGKEQYMRPERLRGKDCNKCRECFIKGNTRPLFEKIWDRMLVGAKRRDYEVSPTLTLDYLIDLLNKQNYICALSGIPLHLAKSASGHTKGGTSASIDRIDSNKGYIEGNIQWVHKDINKSKLNYSQSKFIEYCNNVTEYNKQIPILPEGTLTVF